MTVQELKAKFDAQEWVDVGWTDLVLEQLAPNELADDGKGKKYPRVRGLRRIGSYIANATIVCDVISCNDQYAACKATAQISVSNNALFGQRFSASSMAEATPANVNNEMIAKHLLATAESRAEGRCWTKVLKLNCLTAEEMSLGAAETAKPETTRDIDSEESGMFTDVQRKIINVKCKKAGINAQKYVKAICELNNLDSKTNITKDGISKVLAEKVQEALDIFNREDKIVKEEFKGYVAL